MSAAAGGGVLAVMDEFALYVRNVSSRHALQGDITQARAAVAELIAAAKEAELVLAEKLRRLGADPNVSPTIHKLRAALSNIEGGQA